MDDYLAHRLDSAGFEDVVSVELEDAALKQCFATGDFNARCFSVWSVCHVSRFPLSVSRPQYGPASEFYLNRVPSRPQRSAFACTSDRGGLREQYDRKL